MIMIILQFGFLKTFMDKSGYFILLKDIVHSVFELSHYIRIIIKVNVRIKIRSKYKHYK